MCKEGQKVEATEEKVETIEKSQEQIIDEMLTEINLLKKQKAFYHDGFNALSEAINHFHADTAMLMPKFRKNKKALRVINGALNFTEETIEAANEAIEAAIENGLFPKAKDEGSVDMGECVGEALSKVINHIKEKARARGEERRNSDSEEKKDSL